MMDGKVKTFVGFQNIQDFLLNETILKVSGSSVKTTKKLLHNFSICQVELSCHQKRHKEPADNKWKLQSLANFVFDVRLLLSLINKQKILIFQNLAVRKAQTFFFIFNASHLARAL